MTRPLPSDLERLLQPTRIPNVRSALHSDWPTSQPHVRVSGRQFTRPLLVPRLPDGSRARAARQVSAARAWLTNQVLQTSANAHACCQRARRPDPRGDLRSRLRRVQAPQHCHPFALAPFCDAGSAHSRRHRCALPQLICAAGSTVASAAARRCCGYAHRECDASGGRGYGCDGVLCCGVRRVVARDSMSRGLAARGRPPHSPRELTVMCPGHHGCLHGNGNAGILSVLKQECK